MISIMIQVFVYELDMLWMGGNAVVLAHTEEEAFKMLQKKDNRITREKIKKVTTLDNGTGVKFYWDGDY